MYTWIKSKTDRFLVDQSGAVTVEWVVLSAGAAAMALATAHAMYDGGMGGIAGKILFVEYFVGEYAPDKFGYTCNYIPSVAMSC